MPPRVLKLTDCIFRERFGWLTPVFQGSRVAVSVSWCRRILAGVGVVQKNVWHRHQLKLTIFAEQSELVLFRAIHKSSSPLLYTLSDINCGTPKFCLYSNGAHAVCFDSTVTSYGLFESLFSQLQNALSFESVSYTHLTLPTILLV